jgi:Ran GTPase-activating protein (RanGAP) involved in mRNA processing and transport
MTITNLDLSGNEIGASGVKHLSNLFDDNTTITDLVRISKLYDNNNFN